MGEDDAMRQIYHNGKVVGHINKETYITTRGPQHFFYKFCGFGISTGVLDVLKKQQVTKIRLIYNGKKKKTFYESSVEDWIKKGHIYVYEGDKQLIMNKNYMRVQGE